jgi:hypothetical protein
MPVIARSAALFIIASALALGDAHDDVLEVFTKMAAALTQVNVSDGESGPGNVGDFMSAFSKDMPDYDALKSKITGLVRHAEIASSIAPLMEEDKGATYNIDLDWLLEVRSLEQDGPMVRRREVIHCELRKEKKHWKIISLKPINFFSPANLGQ